MQTAPQANDGLLGDERESILEQAPSHSSRSTIEDTTRPRRSPTIHQISFEGIPKSSFQPSQDAMLDSHAGQLPADLSIVVQLDGGDNWNVRIARKILQDTAAKLDATDAAILPSLNLGVVYNGHDCAIQSTAGDIITASRIPLFVGGGTGVSSTPLNGGVGGPRWLFIDCCIV